MNDLVYYAALSYNEFIGPKRFQTILAQCKNLSNYFDLPISDQMKLVNVKSENAVAFFEEMLEKGEQIIETCRQMDIQMITLEDDNYPPKLRLLPDAPFVLYVRGKLNYSMPWLAVIGTRDPSPDAVSINRYFVTEIVNYNIGIVSGLAKGHDSIAQQVSIENSSYTVAVMGCGVDIVYPPENRHLYNIIAETGAVISEYPPGVQPDRWRFPYRNRLISGLSDAILIVQAPRKSGTLITASFAESQQKDVFVIPGNPTNEKYEGTNILIQKGAKVAIKPEDIVFDLLGERRAMKRKQADLSLLNQTERNIIDLLKDETHIDELIRQSELPVGKLNSILTKLELMGLIVQYPGRFYLRNC